MGSTEKRNLIGSIVVCVAVFILQACTPGIGGDTMLRTELFFGLNKPDGDTVAAVEWQAFVDTCVTPAFQSGFTVVNGFGQWQNEAGVVEKERAKILILLHPANDSSSRLIEHVRNMYKIAFRQQSVLRVSWPVQASF